MTAPVDQLLSSIQALLSTDLGFGIPVIFPTAGEIQIFRGDEPEEYEVGNVVVYQDGAAKERHKLSKCWDIPVKVSVTIDRSGSLGDTPQEVAESIRSYADDIEAVLTMNLLIEAGEPEFTTAPQRLSNDDLYVWDIFNVEVAADDTISDHPSCEVSFTVFCSHDSNVIH